MVTIANCALTHLVGANTHSGSSIQVGRCRSAARTAGRCPDIVAVLLLSPTTKRTAVHDFDSLITRTRGKSKFGDLEDIYNAQYARSLERKTLNRLHRPFSGAGKPRRGLYDSPPTHCRKRATYHVQQLCQGHSVERSFLQESIPSSAGCLVGIESTMMYSSKKSLGMLNLSLAG